MIVFPASLSDYCKEGLQFLSRHYGIDVQYGKYCSEIADIEAAVGNI